MTRFFTTTVERRWIEQKIINNPSLLKALERIKNDLSELDEYAHKQLQQRTDDFLTMQILGAQGSGKSGVGQVLAVRWAKVPFVVENINLHYSGFFENIGRLLNGEFAILDEQTKTYGVGSMRLRGDMVNIIETLRQNGGSIILISPTEKMINTTDVHLEIEVLSRDGKQVLCAWKARSSEYLGAFVLTLDWESPLWVEYMSRKREYVNDARTRKFAKNDYEQLADEVRAHPEYAQAVKKKEKELILEKTLPNLTIEEKKLVLAQMSMQDR